jgi:DNA segregation ATPase FtsK/SpoIIIE, S-DNA-T family
LFAAHGIESMAAFRAAVRSGALACDRIADVFLVADGWGTLRQEFEALEPAITRIAARGLAYGVHVVVAANRWAEIRPQLKELLGTRCELRLGEPFESEVNRRAAANVPEAAPGRGLTKDGLHFLAALPRIDAGADPASTGDADPWILRPVIRRAPVSGGRVVEAGPEPEWGPFRQQGRTHGSSQTP